MAEQLSVTVPRKKRYKIKDAIAVYEERLRKAQADLTHANDRMHIVLVLAQRKWQAPTMRQVAAIKIMNQLY